MDGLRSRAGGPGFMGGLLPQADESLWSTWAGLVGDLHSPSNDLDAALAEARRLVAQAVAAGLVPKSRASVLPTGPVADLQGLLDDPGGDAPQFMVHRRSLPALTTRTDASLPSWAAGRELFRSLGPFHDIAGRDIWIDLFRIVRHVRLVRVAGGLPFLTLPVETFPFPRPFSPTLRETYGVPAGSVWFASGLLAASAPAGSFTGLKVVKGTVRFSQPVSIIADEVVVPMATTVELQLELEAASTPAGSGPGGDSRAANVALPSAITLTVNATTGSISTSDQVRLLVYGVDAEFAVTNGPTGYDSDLKALVLPLNDAVGTFMPSQVESTLFIPSGTASVIAAGWVLPVAVVDPNQLGDASGAGGVALLLADGLRATWSGQAAAVDLGAVVIEVMPDRLSVGTTNAVGDLVAQTPRLGSLQHSTLTLRWGSAFPIVFVAEAWGSEMVLTEASLSAAFEEPVDVRGEPLSLESAAVVVVFLATAAGEFVLVEGVLMPPTSRQLVAFGLVNVLLRSSNPTGLLLAGSYDGHEMAAGIVVLGYRLLGLIPTLPDPYAASVSSLRAELDQGVGALLSTLRWSPAGSDLQFSVPTASPPLGASNRAMIAAPQTIADSRSFVFRDAVDEWPAAEKALGNALAFEQQRGLILLDVSTNVDQFGVAFSSAGRERQGNPAVIKDLCLEVDGAELVLVTLPAVQWEVVETIADPDPFPTLLTFANSGVPTVMGVPTANLVRVHPEAVLQAVVDNFAEAAPAAVPARFTLPFGIVAVAALRAPDLAEPRGATVVYNRPKRDAMQGAHQLRIDAVDASVAPGESASLPGWTVQLPVGQPGSLSVLGPDVTDIFNTYLGSGGARPLVPVTRLDLSGYGESLFSDWHNPYHTAIDAVSVVQARFDVLVGRVAYEVIQVKSYLFPYAVEVVRTITMQRQNNALVTRSDSGWKAVSDGTYQFGNAILTHPGVVTSITNVGQIRDTGQVLTIGGVDMAAVYFDGDLELDGAPGLVPAKAQFGFVQTTAGALLDPTGYAQLIGQAGALGGPVDTSVHVGGGNQVVHLQQVDVGVTAGLGGPEFVMAGWGAPAFPGGGQWSFLQIDDPGIPPVAVSKDGGIPLIRAGLAGTPPSPSSPYRFADPADLALPASPQRDYGILHSTGTQRVLFPRPKIEASSVNEITSTQVPALADPYVLATALGAFPALASTVPFPSATWSLKVSGNGNYQLVMPSTTFPAGVGRRTVRQSGTVKSDLDYTAAHVTYQLDTSQAVPWTFRLDQITKIMNSSSLGDVISLRSNVVASAGTATTFEQPVMAMGGALSVVQDLLTILADLGISGIMHVDMTNDWSLKAALKVPFVDASGESLQIPPLVPIPDIKFDDTGAQVSIKIAPMVDGAEFDIGGHPMFAIKSIPGLYVVAVIKFSVTLSTTDGTTYGLLLGVGFAYSIESGPFGFTGLIALTIFGFISDTSMGFGIGFLLQLSLSIEPIIEIQISLEGQLALVRACIGTGHESLFSVAKLTFGVEVTLCLVFSISIEVETTAHATVQGPGDPTCALPDVLPSAS